MITAYYLAVFYAVHERVLQRPAHVDHCIVYGLECRDVYEPAVYHQYYLLNILK